MITRTRRLAAVTAAAAMTLTATGLAGAQSSESEVNTNLDPGTRQLSVTDLVGNPLTELSLTPGVEAPFAVRVTDTGLGLTEFQVDSTLNNLYLDEQGSPNFTSFIPSSEVTLGYVATPLDALDTVLDLSPDYLINLSSTITAIDCAAVAATLGLTATDVLSDPICTLIDGILGNVPIDVSDVPLNASIIPDIDLRALLAGALPIGLFDDNLDTGVFTDPDCVNGIGQGQCAGAGTAQTVLHGVPVTGVLDGALGDLLGDALGSLTSEIATVSAIIQSLQNAADSATQQLGNRLAAYPLPDQLALIDGLLDLTFEVLDALDILDVSGVYVSFPDLRVDPTTATNGEYAGTMTFTLLEP